jgi:hypothetical protein
MKRPTPKAFIFVLAMICAVGFGAAALAYPRIVSNPALGDEWQCRQTLFLTSCARVGGVQPAVHRFRRDADDIRRV